MFLCFLPIFFPEIFESHSLFQPIHFSWCFFYFVKPKNPRWCIYMGKSQWCSLCSSQERLEAATALKRQMWAEMQLEKRRHKEELLSRSHYPGIVKTDGESPDPENMTPGALPLYDQGPLDMNVPNTDNGGLGEACIGNGKALTGLANGLVAHEAGPSVGGAALAEKSRAQAKADIGLRAEELYVFRSQPLGSDRRHNRYWQFVTGNGGQDPGCGRLFFESNSEGFWGVIDTEEVSSQQLHLGRKSRG